jgi:hypothetical protein
MLYLVICLLMSYGRPEHIDVMVVAEIQEPLASELSVVVRDNAVGNPEAMEDIDEEQCGLL